MKNISLIPVIARPQAVAIHEFQRHGLPRYARSDGNKLVIASCPYPARNRTRTLNQRRHREATGRGNP
ncbi:MAG: hypothetical protein WA062_00160 [Rhodoferax sp.]|uniref:hypothetical protein n=1 Tax=Rhodoferax sp. TaxID=50421 RepID=UPI003BB1D1A0